MDAVRSDGRAHIMDLFQVVDARWRLLRGEQPDHWLARLRENLLTLVAFLVEFHLMGRIEEGQSLRYRPDAPAQYGKLGLRRVHTTVASRMQVVRKMLESHASAEAIGVALANGTRGQAAQLRAVLNQCHSDAAQEVGHKNTPTPEPHAFSRPGSRRLELARRVPIQRKALTGTSPRLRKRNSIFKRIHRKQHALRPSM